MKIVLYTIGCPQCNVLEKKLNNAGVQYEIINDEKFSAQTYCFASDGFDQGDYVVFLDSSPLGACATATIANPATGGICELWCE
jgi:hypothetical protein